MPGDGRQYLGDTFRYGYQPYYGGPYGPRYGNWQGYGYRNRYWDGRNWWRPYPGWGPWGYGYGWPRYYGDDSDDDAYSGPYEDSGVGDQEEEDESVQYGENTPGRGENYLSQAIEAFQQGDYNTALRMAGHAEIDDPRNPEAHLIAALAMFATGDYRGAAVQSRILTSLGHNPTWEQIYQYYGNVRPYTRQIRALERYAKTHQSSAEARLLLGFLYLTGGYRDAAKRELQVAQRLLPRDRIAIVLLRRVGGTPTLETAARPGLLQRGVDIGRQQGQGQLPTMEERRTDRKTIGQGAPTGQQQPNQGRNVNPPQQNQGNVNPQDDADEENRASDSATPQHPTPQGQ